jgi:hypothetical protein
VLSGFNVGTSTVTALLTVFLVLGRRSYAIIGYTGTIVSLLVLVVVIVDAMVDQVDA